MPIVIDISNSTFTDLKKKKNRTEVDVAVLNGTPLSKELDTLQDDIQEDLLKWHRGLYLNGNLVAAEAVAFALKLVNKQFAARQEREDKAKMSDIYVVTRHWDNGEVCNEDFENDEYPFMAFSTSENAMEYLKHNLSRDDILGDLAGLYDEVKLYEPEEGEYSCGVWYKCRDPYSGHTVNVRFIIYKIKMGD